MTMAGEYPGSKYDPVQCPFVPAQFRAQGYQTAQIGKWHTGTDTGFGRDWDFQIVWNRPAHPENAGSYYNDQLLTFNGVDKQTAGYSTDNYSQWASEYILAAPRSGQAVVSVAVLRGNSRSHNPGRSSPGRFERQCRAGTRRHLRTLAG